jgi:hypothetical protein
MEDLLYLGVALVFLVLTWGLMRLCVHLEDYQPGEHP